MNKIGIRQFVIYFSIFIFQFSSIFGQSNPLNLPQKLYFNQAYIYEYSSSVIPEGEYGHCWLFTDESYGVGYAEVQWVVGFPNGIYLTAISDDSGQKSLLSDTIKFSKKIEERLSEIGSFEETHKNTGEMRTYGKDAMGFPLYNADHYTIVNTKNRDVIDQYITNSRIMANSLYFFNDRKAELKLPLKFPTDIPMGMLVLEEITKTIDGEFHLKLKDVKNIDYAINLKEYR